MWRRRWSGVKKKKKVQPQSVMFTPYAKRDHCWINSAMFWMAVLMCWWKLVKQPGGYCGRRNKNNRRCTVKRDTPLFAPFFFFLIGPILPPQAWWQPTVARRPETFFLWLQKNNNKSLISKTYRVAANCRAGAPLWLVWVWVSPPPQNRGWGGRTRVRRNTKIKICNKLALQRERGKL